MNERTQRTSGESDHVTFLTLYVDAWLLEQSNGISLLYIVKYFMSATLDTGMKL